MNIREWVSLDKLQAVVDNQKGFYDDIFDFFSSFYHMMVFEKSFIFSQPNTLGDLEIDILDEYCRKLFKEFLSPYASACTDEVIGWCVDRELLILISTNDLSETEKSRVYMFSILLKRALRFKIFCDALENLRSIESLVNEFCSGSVKQSCYKRFMEIEKKLKC